MNIEMSPEQISQLFGAALLKEIGEDTRNKLLENALAYLIQPTKDSYNRISNSPLELCYRRAIEKYTEKEIEEWLNNNEEVRIQIRNLFIAAWDKMIKSQGEDTIKNLACKFSRVLSQDY
jgi:hypothetical protein